MKKAIVLILLCVLTLLPLCGCVKEPEMTDTDDDTGAVPAVGIPGAEPNITLNIWCSITKNDPMRHALEAALKELKETYPNITANVESFEGNSYETKLKAAASHNELPDIFFVPKLNILNEFYEDRKVYCLDDAYQKFKGELPESMLTGPTFDGRHYGYPTVFGVIGMYANTDLLKEAGYDEVPKTYEEFLECLDALKDKGIIPFGCSGKETECVAKCTEVIMQKSVGADTLNDIFFGRGTFNNDGLVEAIDTFQSLINNGYFDPTGIAQSNDEIKRNFIDGLYAFYVSDSGCMSEFCDDATNPGFGDKVRFTLFPAINAEKASVESLVGGPNNTFAVAENSEKKETAAEYAGELARLICHYAYLDGCGIPAWTPYGDDSTVPDNVKEIVTLCGTLKSFTPYSRDSMNEFDLYTYYSYIDQVYECAIDGNGFVDGLSKDIR